MKKMAFLVYILISGNALIAADDREIRAMRRQIAELTERVARLEKALAAKDKGAPDERVEHQQTKARQRMKTDGEVYSSKELRDIEELYQAANKRWQTQEGKDSLKELVRKYEKANRTGCALLFLGQVSEGTDKEEYLIKAITDYSNCWYGDGVQVGAYARFNLALHYRDEGQLEKAKKLFEELKQRYPDAIDHQGTLLTSLIPDD